MKQIIDYKLWIHQLPTDLQKPLAEDREYLDDTSDLYQAMVDSPFVFPVWMIDEFDQHWIELHPYNGDAIEHHSLTVDEGTYTKVASEEYEIDVEKPLTDEAANQKMHQD